MLGAYIHWMCMTSCFFFIFLTSRPFHLAHHFTPYICHLLCDVYFPKPHNYILILFVVKCYVCIRLDFSLIITMHYFNSLKCTIWYFNFELFFLLPQWNLSHSSAQQLFQRMHAHGRQPFHMKMLKIHSIEWQWHVSHSIVPIPTHTSFHSIFPSFPFHISYVL